MAGKWPAARRKEPLVQNSSQAEAHYAYVTLNTCATPKRNAVRKSGKLVKNGEWIERRTHESEIIPGDATTMWDFLMDFH